MKRYSKNKIYTAGKVFMLMLVLIALGLAVSKAIQGPGVNQPGSGEGALKLDTSGRIGINQGIGSITERLHIGGILRAKKLIGGYNGGVTADRIGDPILGGGVFNNGAAANFAFPVSLAVGVATTTGISADALTIDGVLIASGTIYSAATALPVFSKEWTLNADWNAAGTLFDPGLENPAVSDELKLKKDAYKYRRTLTVDGAKITGNLTDFPALVKLTSSTPVNFDFSKAQPDGDDIRFASTTTGLGYAYEIESWNPTQGEAYIWVKIPSLVASQSQNFYMYYGNEFAVSAASPTEVWDSNFVMVQHLEETTGQHIDSTSKNNNSTMAVLLKQGTASGKADGSDEFDGASSVVSIPDSNSLDTTSTITVEAWINSNENMSNRVIVGKLYNTSWFFGSHVAGTNRLQVLINNDRRAETPITPGVVSIGAWYHVSFTYNSAGGGTDEIKVYVDGVVRATGDYSTPIGVDGSDVRIGFNQGASGFQYNGYPFKGRIDEVRISNTARTAGWIKASYESGNNTLLTYGAEAGM